MATEMSLHFVPQTVSIHCRLEVNGVQFRERVERKRERVERETIEINI